MHLSCQNISPLAMLSFFPWTTNPQWSLDSLCSELWKMWSCSDFKCLNQEPWRDQGKNLSTSVQITETIKLQLNLLMSFDNPHKNISSIFLKQRSIQRAWDQQNPLWYRKLKLALMAFASWRGYSKSMPSCLLICREPAEFVEVMRLQEEC